MLSNMFVKLSREIYRKVYLMTIFFISKNVRKSNIQLANVVMGQNCAVDSSAIFTTTGNGQIGLDGDNYVGRNAEIGTGETIKIGYGTSIQDRCIILGDIEIGKYCLFSLNVHLSSGRHYYNFRPEYYIKDQDALVMSDKELSKKHSQKIVIGDDCWLGINSVVMPGIKIGRGSVIGANSVVTKDIQPFSIAVGAPAKVIKKRLNFSPKNSLNFMNDDDLANFYKGFFIDQKNLRIDRDNGGIAAANKFTCYLESNNKSKLIISIKKLTNHSISITYNDQKMEINTNTFQEVAFEVIDSKFHEFIINSTKYYNENHKIVLVNSICSI